MDFNKQLDRSSLGRKTKLGAIQVFSGQAGKFLIQLGSTAILARLLTPDDFGLIAMVAVIVRFIELFRDFGLTQATIQRERVSHVEISSLFWINIGISLLLAGTFVAIAPAVARFYGRPELSLVTSVYGLIVICEGIGAQHRALLARSMSFLKLTIVDVLALVISVGVAVSLAILGLGYWALVAQVASSAIVASTGYCLTSGWKPGPFRLKTDVRDYLHYGANLAGFKVTAFVTRNVDNLLIGWQHGGHALGLYSRAYQLLMLPVSQINTPATTVILPILCRLQKDPEEYERIYLRSVRAVASLSFPLLGICAVAAEPIILIVFGHQWHGMIPIFLALLPATLISALNITTGWVFQSMGTTGRQLKWSLFSTPIHVAGMILGLPWGPLGIAIAISSTFIILRVPLLIYAYRGTSLSVRKLMQVLSRCFGVNLCAVAAVTMTEVLLRDLSMSSFSQLGVSAFVYLSVLSASEGILPRSGSMRELVEEMFQAIKRRDRLNA